MRGQLSEGDHLGNGRAVFALQRFEQSDPLLELRKLFRIEIEPFGITIEGSRHFRQFDNRAGMSSGSFRQAGVDLLQLPQKPLRFRELV